MDIRFSDDTAAYMLGQLKTIFGASAGYCTIYKGAFPTVNPDSTYINTTRASDKLIAFVWGSNDANRWDVSGRVMSLPSNKLPAPIAAIASGTATWFSISHSSAGVVCGSVSGPAGGGDLVISDTNIVSGLVYSMSPISFTLQTTMTY
jgi:hypothetical protein